MLRRWISGVGLLANISLAGRGFDSEEGRIVQDKFF